MSIKDKISHVDAALLLRGAAEKLGVEVPDFSGDNGKVLMHALQTAYNHGRNEGIMQVLADVQVIRDYSISSDDYCNGLTWLMESNSKRKEYGTDT